MSWALVTRSRHTLIALVLLAITLVHAPLVAVAQQEPTDEQRRLYVAAHDAYRRQAYDEAIALLEQALALGDLNLLHLSLGLALLRANRCTDADGHLRLAAVAPPVVDPPAVEVRARAAEYLAELGARCRPAEPPAGTFAPAPAAPPSSDAPALAASAPAPPDESPSNPARTMSFVAAGAGAAVLAFAIVADVALLGAAVEDFEAARAAGDEGALDAQSRAETWRALAITGYALGAAAIATGAVLFILSGDADAERDPSPRARAWLAPDAAGVTVAGRF